MKIFFTASRSALAQMALSEFTERYGQTPMQEADIIVALGGDGHLLHTLYGVMETHKPVFAIRRTESVGFLCNDYNKNDLLQRLQKAQSVMLHPLRFEVVTVQGTKHLGSAINEVSILRETPQAAKLSILIDGVERIAKFNGDGILIASPAGSTAYNHSCGGPILPLDANVLVMTAICGYRPRGWSYAVLPQTTLVEIEAQEISKRPVRIEAGASVIHNAAKVKIWLDKTKDITLLFDPDQHLGERIIKEQFML
jgi:NAD+ kinase